MKPELYRLDMVEEFPSPCGVRRVRDKKTQAFWGLGQCAVSVPLRGKEGAGRTIYTASEGIVLDTYSFRPLAG